MGRPMESFLYGLIAFGVAAGLIALISRIKKACTHLLEQTDFR